MAKTIIAPVPSLEIGLTFYQDINEIVSMYEILAGLNINIDQMR